jgi:RNA polymerase sigma-70 factor, ECF subfamily
MADSTHEQAFRVFMAHQAMLHAYVGAIVREPALAEDTLSDVAIELARSWTQYDQSRPFPLWARGVARRVALANLRKWKRAAAPLDEDALEALGTRIEALTRDDLSDQRGRALASCLEGVGAAGRKLLRLRYVDDLQHAEIAVRTGRTTNALYVAFHRLHGALAECIRKRLEPGV